jgi:hypothetical protein
MALPGVLPPSKIEQLEPGSEVLVRSEANVGRVAVIRRGRVVRLTKTQVIVEINPGPRGWEERFRREDGVEYGKTSTWSAHSSSQLMDPEHESTVRLQVEQVERDAVARIVRAFEAWRENPTDRGRVKRLYQLVGDRLDSLVES